MMNGDSERPVAYPSMLVGAGGLPANWRSTELPAAFETLVSDRRLPAMAQVKVFESLAENPDYLLGTFRTTDDGPLGRPLVQSLPEPLADGISVVSFHESVNGALTSRIDLVRRAWNLDIIVSATTLNIESVEGMFSAMLELLSSVRPKEEGL